MCHTKLVPDTRKKGKKAACPITAGAQTEPSPKYIQQSYVACGRQIYRMREYVMTKKLGEFTCGCLAIDRGPCRGLQESPARGVGGVHGSQDATDQGALLPRPPSTASLLLSVFSPSRSQPRPTPGAAPLTLPRRPRGRCTRPNDPHGYAKPEYLQIARNLRKSRSSQNRCLNALKCSRLRFRTKFHSSNLV